MSLRPPVPLPPKSPLSRDRERDRGAALASSGKRRDAGVRVRSHSDSLSKVPHPDVTTLAGKELYGG